jgi:hypothetical protein
MSQLQSSADNAMNTEKVGAGPSKGVDAKDIAARLQEIGESSKLDPAATPAAPAATPAQKLPIRPAGDNGLSVQKTRAAPGATAGAPSEETRKVSATKATTKANLRIASLGRTGPEATPRSLSGETRKVSATANPTAVPKKDPKATAASGKNKNSAPTPATPAANS